MKKEELRAWAESLKPGDKVVKTLFWNDTPVDVLTVERLTKTGRVVTNQGTYHMTGEWASCYKGYGSAEGSIIPATPENISVAEEYKMMEQERIHKQNVIQKAENIVYNLFYNGMSYEIALKIIALTKEATHEK